MTISNGSSAGFSVAEAKARLSEVIDRAKSQGAQRITRYGRDAAYIVSAEEWHARRGQPLARPTMLEFFEPLRGSELSIDGGEPLAPAVDVDE